MSTSVWNVVVICNDARCLFMLQARAMCRCYRDATLLIEFEKGKAFSLQSRQALGTDIDSTNILSK